MNLIWLTKKKSSFDFPFLQAPGGRFAMGILTRHYTPGQDIVVKVDVTANHKGFFTFKLCANNNTDQDPRQECFDQTVLKVRM